MMIDSVISMLKSKGYRLTNIRKMVIKILWNKEHLVLSDLVLFLKEEKIVFNLASIYNTVSMLLKEQLIWSYTFDGKNIWYEIKKDFSLAHFFCINCKKVEHLNNNFCKKHIKLKDIDEKYIINLYKIEAYGICKECHDKKIL